MTATPKQRASLTMASLVVGHSVMAINHQGFIGAILATAAGMAAWAYADEVFDKLNTGEPSAPPTGGTRATHSVMRRLLTTREQRQERRRLLALDNEDEEQLDEDDENDEDDWQQEEALIALDEDGASIKTFRQLLEDGTITSALKRREMVLGYADGKLVTTAIKRFYSCGIGGVSGMGKSTTVRLLLFQFALLKARLVIIDPHIGEEEEGLAASFAGFRNIHALPPCGEEVQEIEKRIHILMREYLRRKEHGIKGPPLMLAIDELNGLMRRLPAVVRLALSELILTLEGEARKFGMCCLLIGQRWSEQDLGGKPHGAAIRDSLSTCIAHRFQSEDQAKKLIGSQYSRRATALRTGQYLFRDAEGEVTHICTPNTLSSDAVLVQRVLDQWQREREAKSATERRGELAEELEVGDAQEERTSWDVAKDAVVMPEKTVQMGALDEEGEEEQVRERPMPVMQEKGPRAEDIDLALAIELWNKGYNSDRELARVFRMTQYQANRLSKMIKEEARKQEGSE